MSRGTRPPALFRPGATARSAVAPGGTEMPRGGHFAAMEEPKLVGDVRAFFRKLR